MIYKTLTHSLICKDFPPREFTTGWGNPDDRSDNHRRMDTMTRIQKSPLVLAILGLCIWFSSPHSASASDRENLQQSCSDLGQIPSSGNSAPPDPHRSASACGPLNAPAPEPSILLVLGSGLAGLGAVMRRRHRKEAVRNWEGVRGRNSSSS
jgi:hypothetical protein